MNSSALRCESLNLSLSWMTFRVWERRLNHPIGKSYMAHLNPRDWMTSDPKANENECVRKEKALKTRLKNASLGRLQELQVKGNKQWFYRFLGFTGMQQVWQLRYFGLLLSKLLPVYFLLSVPTSREFHEILVPVPTRPSNSMEDSQIDKLFAGDMENLPPWRQPLIRLYLSSTYTDMTLEKTSLFAEVYPKLKEYCREKYGLEFQVSSILT